MSTKEHSIFYTKRGHEAAKRLAAGGLKNGMALDARGRLTSLAPRTKGAISIGTQADADKQQRIKRGTI